MHCARKKLSDTYGCLKLEVMENTGKVLFEDDTPRWYIALGSRWIGPLSAEDVYQKVLSQEITWAHFVWCPGQQDWKRICDTPTFQGAVPAIPTQGVKEEVKEASKPSIRTAQASGGRAGAAGKGRTPPPPQKTKAETREWFLYYNDAQYGPFSGEEIGRFLRVGKIHGRVHIWKDGMADWQRLEEVARFEEDVAESKLAREIRKAAGVGGKSGPTAAKSKSAASSSSPSSLSSAREQRKAPRRPIVAKIYVANSEALTVAVCRDISVGGMQVLTDRIPGEPGSRIKLNVSPASSKGDRAAKGIEPFVAEGVIVRILEDGRGFSFRFERLPESSRRVIEDYLRLSA
jgi:hypothetical protein